MNSRTVRTAPCRWGVIAVATALWAAGFVPLTRGSVVIISDTFSRTGNLAGTTPDVDTTAEAHTWGVYQNTPANITTDGSVAQVPGQNSPYADLPFQLSDVQGSLVTLKADLTISDPTDGSAYWVALGFVPTTTTPANGGTPWLLFTAGGGAGAFGGPGVANQFPGGIASGPGTSAAATLALTYDKSDNVASFYVNGVFEASYTYASAPTIAAVSFSTDAPNGLATVDNFTVLDNIPEPSTILLLGLGGVLIRRARKMRRAARRP